MSVSDTEMLDFVQAEYLDVVAFTMPIPLSSDADVGWRLLQHHMGEKEPREVAVSHHDDVRVAIRNAMQALGYQPRGVQDDSPSGETMQQREAVCAAWHALPDELRKDSRLNALYHALGGPLMESPPDALAQAFAVAVAGPHGVLVGDGTGDALPPVSQQERVAAGVRPVEAQSCDWTEEDPFGQMPGTYESACGELWSFTDGGVKENGVKFCHNCGKPVNVIPFPQPADEEDDAGVEACAVQPLSPPDADGSATKEKQHGN